MDKLRSSSTLRNQLLAAFVLLVLLPVIVISFSSALINWRVGQQRVIDQLDSVTILKEAEIARWVSALQDSLMAALQDTEGDWLKVILTSSPASPTTQQAVGNAQDDWRRLVKYTSLFDEVFLMDRQGRVVLSNGPTKVNTVHRNQAYFQKGLQEPYIHPPTYSPSLNRMSVVVAQPVTDRQGNMIGVLAGRASMAVLNEIMLERTGLGQTGETYLVGSKSCATDSSPICPS